MANATRAAPPIPPPPERRAKQVHVRVTQSEFDAWERWARNAGWKLSELIRYEINRAVESGKQR